ncbi:hypothetical protein ACIA8I_41580 [Streptomyces rishiriensis]|uniref:hypothetical protein n=1 Tax=Streptomyces rishiriensis TaxID=68264 RepID=UPI0037A6E042
MNLTSTITAGIHDAIVIGNIFSEVNRLVSQATTTIQAAMILVGIIAFIVISGRGSWRMNAVFVGIFVGGLLIWGAIGGVPWMADQAESTIGMGLTTPSLGV